MVRVGERGQRVGHACLRCVALHHVLLSALKRVNPTLHIPDPNVVEVVGPRGGTFPEPWKESIYGKCFHRPYGPIRPYGGEGC